MPTMAMSTAPARAGQRGAGVLSTVFGVAVMLVMLAVTTHVAVGLWDRTTVESAAYDAAREVATAPEDSAPVRARALERARGRLGSRARGVRLEFRHRAGDESVALHVESRPIGLMPVLGGRPTIVDGLDRTIRIRREEAATP